MSREVHVRFCEQLRGRLPRLTRPVAESFFKTLKVELIYQEDLVDFAHCQRLLFEYNNIYYNKKRRHSYLGYVSPEQFSRKMAA